MQMQMNLPCWSADGPTCRSRWLASHSGHVSLTMTVSVVFVGMDPQRPCSRPKLVFLAADLHTADDRAAGCAALPRQQGMALLHRHAKHSWNMVHTS